jgi:hypothetical protein
MNTLRRLKATHPVTSSTFDSDSDKRTTSIQRQPLSASSTAETLTATALPLLADPSTSPDTSSKGHEPHLTSDSQSSFRSLKSRLSRTSSRLGLRKRRTILQEISARTSSNLPGAEVQAAFIPQPALKNTSSITSPLAGPALSPETCVPLLRSNFKLKSLERSTHTFVKMASENSQPVSYSRLQDITISVR